MKLFLDENITPRAKGIFEQLGYDVESIHSYNKSGINDQEVLNIVIRENRILITQNGKDFIVQIPPIVSATHFGLIWIRFHVTRMNINNVCLKIDRFLKSESSINNSIWKVKEEDISLCFNKRYPPPAKVVSY